MLAIVSKSRLDCIATSLIVLMVISVTPPASAANVDCMDTKPALDYWRPIREAADTSGPPPGELAVELMSCLGSRDPELRDQIGYELFTYWLREGELTDNTRRTLLAELSGMMSRPPPAIPGDATFARSFSALILSELMRSDSVQPFMSGDERKALLNQSIESLGQENDYRGLDPDLGWVHPVAHMSDLLWRFALHPETSGSDAESILDAIRAKVAPKNIFFRFNESDRLARVVTTMIVSKKISTDAVAAWLRTFEAPTSMKEWPDAFASPMGMAELHNTKLFLRALSDQLDGADVDMQITAPLSELVQAFTQLI